MRNPQRVAQFTPGIGGQVFKCGRCHKMTRETGAGESGVELCARCLAKSYRENFHHDSGHAGAARPSCKACIAGGYTT